MNTKVIALLEEALRLLKQPEGPSARDIALAKIGTHVETAYLVVQIHSLELNGNRGGKIVYSHPGKEEKKEYWVTQDKFDISVWDELEGGKYYLVESHKFTKPSRVKDRWVWMQVAELDEDVAIKSPGYGKTIPSSIVQWSNEN